MNQQQLTNEIVSIDEFNDLIIDSIQDIKGKKIVKLDLRGLDATPSDFFIVCEGESNTQVKSIADNIRKRVKEELGLFPSHAEGVQDGVWALLDYFNVIIHVFHPEKRAFYDLENLWSDAAFTEYDSL